MTSLTTPEIEAYYDRVRLALTDLSPDVLDELVEELPDHLAEVAAEQDGRLVDRLGEPEDYAAELRAAAGLEPVTPVEPTAPALADRLTRAVRTGAELADRFDVRAARLVGYGRLTELARAVQPGWWVLRGWVAAQLLSGTHDRGTWNGFLPRVGGSWLLGLILSVLAIMASVWLGRRSAGWPRWGRRLLGGGGAVLTLWALLVLAPSIGGGSYDYGYTDSGYSGTPAGLTDDVYVYDRAGKLVPGARLFGSDGNPLQIGSETCQNGDPATGTGIGVGAGTGDEQWSYPLCPSDPGPFRAGPGAVASAPGASTPAMATPATSAPATSAPATAAPATSAPATSAPGTAVPRTSAARSPSARPSATGR